MNKSLAIFGIVAVVLGAVLLAYLMFKPKKSTCRCHSTTGNSTQPVTFPQFVDPYVDNQGIPSYKPMNSTEFLNTDL